MRTDGGRVLGRPRGAVLRPLGLLLVAALTGFGMWHVLVHDGLGPDDGRLTRHHQARSGSGGR
jgi:hypothetical protein